MTGVVNAQPVRSKAIDKQRIEQVLAERLYEAFNNANALLPLRATVKSVLEAMLDGPKTQLTHALWAEKDLRVLGKYPPIGAPAIKKDMEFDSKGWILSLFRNLNHFSAADCYDVYSGPSNQEPDRDRQKEAWNTRPTPFCDNDCPKP